MLIEDFYLIMCLFNLLLNLQAKLFLSQNFFSSDFILCWKVVDGDLASLEDGLVDSVLFENCLLELIYAWILLEEQWRGALGCWQRVLPLLHVQTHVWWNLWSHCSTTLKQCHIVSILLFFRIAFNSIQLFVALYKNCPKMPQIILLGFVIKIQSTCVSQFVSNIHRDQGFILKSG